MPLCCDLDQDLPLPSLKGAKVVWPKRYSWSGGASRLEPIKRELSRWIPVELREIADRDLGWHSKGGFPVPLEKRHLIGKPLSPAHSNDIRGEILKVHIGDRVVRCAIDYSDYPIVSTDTCDHVDVYFKCVPPPGPLPSNVLSAGYYPKNARLLAKARATLLTSPPKRRIGVYGRFGTWTDSQRLRETIVSRLSNSSLDFTGGFAVKIYPAYLQEMMLAKVALDLPGQAPFTCRIVEAMALGAVVVSVNVSPIFPEELIDGVHYVAVKDDGSDVVEVCERLLRDDQGRQRIAEQGMMFFDRNFSAESVARRILRGALERPC
jgi:glycosyltransferase involved in cell wall biosynthesis